MPRSASLDGLNTLYNQIRSHKLTDSESVDTELQKLLSLVVRDYIQDWFAHISDDPEFTDTLLESLGHVTREAERRLKKVDWVALLSRDVPLALRNHLSDHKSVCGKLGTAYAGGRSLEELFQPHVALNDPRQSTFEGL